MFAAGVGLAWLGLQDAERTAPISRNKVSKVLRIIVTSMMGKGLEQKNQFLLDIWRISFSTPFHNLDDGLPRNVPVEKIL
jgi:hypothetical protein